MFLGVTKNAEASQLLRICSFVIPLFVAARARGQGLDGCRRSLANLECFHIYLAWNNTFFPVNTTRKSGKLQVIKRQVVENCFQQRRQLSPLSATLLLIFFHVRMVAGPLRKAQREKERKKIHDKARALAQGSNMQGIRNQVPF